MGKKEKKVQQPSLLNWNKKQSEQISKDSDLESIIPAQEPRGHTRISKTINQAFNGHESKERKLYSFPPGTPIFLENQGGVLYAEREFIAERINGRIRNYSAFKLTANTLVYRQRGWEDKKYFHLHAEDRAGLSTSSQGYRPKKLK
jgi:hypothetical protein